MPLTYKMKNTKTVGTNDFIQYRKDEYQFKLKNLFNNALEKWLINEISGLKKVLSNSGADFSRYILEVRTYLGVDYMLMYKSDSEEKLYEVQGELIRGLLELLEFLKIEAKKRNKELLKLFDENGENEIGNDGLSNAKEIEQNVIDDYSEVIRNDIEKKQPSNNYFIKEGDKYKIHSGVVEDYVDIIIHLMKNNLIPIPPDKISIAKTIVYIQKYISTPNWSDGYLQKIYYKREKTNTTPNKELLDDILIIIKPH